MTFAPSAAPFLEDTDPAWDGAAHLRAELDLLELRLRIEILRLRSRRGEGNGHDEFAGLYIPDEEIDGYWREADAAGAGPVPDGEASGGVAGEVATELEERLTGGFAALEERLHAAAEAGTSTRLSHLREAFDLSLAEYAMLLACLAPDLGLRFERYFSYLQNDVSKRRPCVQLLGRLFLPGDEELPALHRIFAGEEGLVARKLLELGRSGPEQGFPSREPRPCEGLVHFLLEVEAPDPDWKGLGRWRRGSPLPEGPAYFDRHQALLRSLVEHAQEEGCLPLAYLSAPSGCAKEDLVLGVSEKLDALVLEWDAEDTLSFTGDFADRLAVMERDLKLFGAFLWIRHGEAFSAPSGGAATPDGMRARLKALGDFLAARTGINALLTGERLPAELRTALAGSPRPLVEMDIPAPDLGERAGLWKGLLDDRQEGDGLAPEERRLLRDGLAAKFRFGPGPMVSVLRSLSHEDGRSLSRPVEERSAPAPRDAAFWEATLLRACRQESQAGLSGFARRLPCKYRWEDLVLPQDILEQLREVRNCVRHRRQVFGEWGFEGKFSLGKGLNLLFSGPSGTGKTMSAEVLAGDLGLELYQIDLSTVISKYIGETEKNLARIFGAAQSANGILLFDEADALFGKRSEVKDSHDRYANIEINYLLQRMEEYEGLVILTTNMLRNMDPAFTRRIHYTVEFPLPDERHREILWSQVFPEALPRAGDLDLGFLARRFKLTGANIKNIALSGAFLAAANGGTVGMDHLIRALKREYRKLGRLPSKGEFGPYYHLVTDDGQETVPEAP